MALRTNLCPNPAVKNNTTDWFGGSRIPNATGLPRATAYSATSSTSAVLTPRGTVTGGQQYTFSVYFKATGNGTARAGIDWYASGSYSSSTSDVSVSVTNGQTYRLVVTATAPSRVTQGLMVLRGVPGQYTAVLYERGPLGDYFDGDSPGGSWTGTSGNSTSQIEDTPTLRPPGAVSEFAAGIPSVNPGPVSIAVGPGPGTGEAAGTPLVAPAQDIKAPPSVPSAEAAGTPRVVPGTTYVKPPGTASSEAVPKPTVAPGTVVLKAGAFVAPPDEDMIGTPNVTYGIAAVDLPKAYPHTETPYPQVQYELVCVARVPQASGPPLLLPVDPIDWVGLGYTDELSKPQQLSASVNVSALTEPVIQRLRQLQELGTELWLYRNGVMIFAGPLLGWQVQSDTVTLNASGLLSYLRWFYVLDDLTFKQVDQHLIATRLIDQWQETPYGHFGIDTTTVTASGVQRDATYLKKELHQVSKRVEELGLRQNGFDIEIDPSSRTLRCWYPQQGVDRSTGEDAVIFDARNITSGDIICSAAPGDVASDVFGTGTGNDSTIWSEKANQDMRQSFGRAGYAQTFDGVSEQATLDSYTQGALDARDSVLLVPGPGVRTTTDADLASYDVGDVVAYQLHEQLGVDGAFRIRKRTVTVSKVGTEQTAVEFV